ncbi:MAG TPA: phosphate ABC transporter ATP-binding protein PstB [Bacteroidia bacterium]|jgi:phosphate transport system ATP-binding protein|nr:phosphate ABC transporter ATP-binding protein PstB [Bacteroidia bacterium]
MEGTILRTENLCASFGSNQILKNINIDIPEKKVTAFMGPSGCGKTTFLRCINRMHELNPEATVQGKIRLHYEDVYQMDAMTLRRRVGMVFQRPNPFPTMSIYENVIAGFTLNGIKIKTKEKDEIVEDSLKKVALWDEVKDNLTKRATSLSGGQQQRLCLARTVAMKPEVILLDEPTSALDPLSTAKIEDLLYELKGNYTMVIVTHNMQQAARISDVTAFFYLGELLEFDDTKKVFTNPKHEKTQNYITGRFG